MPSLRRMPTFATVSGVAKVKIAPPHHGLPSSLHHGRSLPTHASVGVGYLCRQFFSRQDICRQKMESRGKSSRRRLSRQTISLPTLVLLACLELCRHLCYWYTPYLCRHLCCWQTLPTPTLRLSRETIPMPTLGM